MLNLSHASFGPFEILHHVADGGMAKVYAARDVRTGGLVALKVLDASSDYARFEREVKILAGAVHPRIVGYVGHGITQGGHTWIAMEWLEGEDLEERLQRGPLTIDETLTVGRTLAGVLGYLHGGGVVHRDLKPANVFLVDREIEQLRLLDFGIAGDINATVITKAGTLMGTAQYMAPEQAIDVRRVDARTDVFALGAILFHCITGETPYAGASLHQIIGQVVRAKVRRVSEMVRHVPPGLDALIARMMARRPEDRPASGRQALLELSSIHVGHYFDDESVTRIRAAPRVA